MGRQRLWLVRIVLLTQSVQKRRHGRGRRARASKNASSRGMICRHARLLLIDLPRSTHTQHLALGHQHQPSFLPHAFVRPRLQLDIGWPNRQLIAEWNGTAVEPARQKLVLCFESDATAADWLQAAGSPMEWLWAHPACRELWVRYLGRYAGWLAAARHVLTTACDPQCSGDDVKTLLERLLLQYPAGSRIAAALLKATSRSVIEGVRRQVRAVVNNPSKRGALLESARSAADAELSRRANHLRGSQLMLCCARLAHAEPSRRPLALNDFTLIRRLGRGSYGTVFAGRKEDTLGLLALKVFSRHRLRQKRQLRHLLEVRLRRRLQRDPQLLTLPTRRAHSLFQASRCHRSAVCWRSYLASSLLSSARCCTPSMSARGSCSRFRSCRCESNQPLD